jgi:lysophospholipid acyltransferase (LPLAT)-like uncharacterized protein
MPEAVPKITRVVVPHRPKWFQRLGAGALVGLEHALTATLRFHLVDDADLLKTQRPGPVIFCIWHNRLALAMYAYRNVMRKNHPDRPMAALVSASKDGAFLASVLESFEVQPVRGSSSRRGAQALLELVSWAERGYDLAITPDGPRGPRYTVQDGVMSLAQLTGLPIVPASYHVNFKYELRSWDRFQVPLPFARCELRLAKAVCVPRDISDAERGEYRLLLEQRMMDITID